MEYSPSHTTAAHQLTRVETTGMGLREWIRQKKKAAAVEDTAFPDVQVFCPETRAGYLRSDSQPFSAVAVHQEISQQRSGRAGPNAATSTSR